MRALTLLVTVLTLGSACADDDDRTIVFDGAPVDSATDADIGIEMDADLTATLADLCDGKNGVWPALLRKILECNPEFAFLIGGTPDIVALQATCEGTFGRYVADGSEVLGDVNLLAACAAYLSSSSCAQLDTGEPGPCDFMVLGTIATAGTCEDSEQCAGDAYCKKAGAGCGTCKPRVGNGMACTVNQDCSSRRCVGTACMPTVPMGGACVDGGDCAGGLLCALDMTCQPEPPGVVAAPCRTGDLTACNSYASGLFCRPTAAGDPMGTCQPFQTLGLACTVMPAPSALVCDYWKNESCQDVGGQLQCVAPTLVQVGQECQGFNGTLQCDSGLTCRDHDAVAGTPPRCVLLGAEGDACTGNTCDVFMSCAASTMTCQYGYTGMCPAP